MMRRVEGEVAIVTGGARGIGAECARLLAREGAKVLLTDLDERAGCDVAEEILASGGSSLYVHQDVTDASSWKAVFKLAEKLFGEATILVNHVDIAFSKSVEKTAAENWPRMLSSAVDPVFPGTQHGIAAMREGSGNGSIINISSVAGLAGNSVVPVHRAARSGVRIFTRSATPPCSSAVHRIRVNSVHPGFIWTPMAERFFKELGFVEENHATIARLYPADRPGEPVEMADSVLYLASEESSFLTGSELVIDGGFVTQ